MTQPGTTRADRLPRSRLYTFVDEAREFALFVLEGQRLIHDLALTHPIRGRGFAYFRDVVLSVQPMIALLKPGEQLGFYIDSTEPYFKLKIEAGQHGATRCTLFPEDFQEFPEAMHGLVRVQNVFPRNRPRYESVLKIEALPLREVVNRVLKESYQVNSAIVVSQQSDQSAMLHQFPPLRGADDYEFSADAVQARRREISEELHAIFARALHRRDEIERAFAGIGFRLVANRVMRFECSCSQQRMVFNLGLVCGDRPQRLFDPGQRTLELTCEYCKSRYVVSREELERSIDPVN